MRSLHSCLSCHYVHASTGPRGLVLLLGVDVYQDGEEYTSSFDLIIGGWICLLLVAGREQSLRYVENGGFLTFRGRDGCCLSFRPWDSGLWIQIYTCGGGGNPSAMILIGKFKLAWLWRQMCGGVAGRFSVMHAWFGFGSIPYPKPRLG